MAKRIAAVLFGMFVVGATVGFGQVVGLKVTPTTIAPPQVDFDITVYATDTGNSPGNLIVPAPFASGNYSGTLSTYTNGTTYPPTPTSGTTSYFFTRVIYRSDGSWFSGWSGFDTPNRPAVDFGDGVTQATASLALDATAVGPGGTSVYRGSFSHSYGSAGTYTITARKGPDWDFGAPGAHDSTTGVTTGSAVTGSLYRFSTYYYSVFYYRYYYFGTVTSGGARNTSLTGSSFDTAFFTSGTFTSPYSGTVVSVNNTASTGQVPVNLLRFDVE